MKNIKIIWEIIIFTILQLSKDIKSLAILLLMPFILIAILGISLAGMFNGSDFSFEQVQLGIVDEDKSFTSRIFIDNAFNNVEIEKIVKAEEYTKEEAEKKFDSEEIDGILYLHKGYGDNYAKGIPDEVVLKMNPKKSTQTEVIRMVSDQYHIIGHMVLDIYYGDDSEIEFPTVNSFLGEQILTMDISSVGENEEYVDAFQYYTIGMGVMYALFTVFTGVGFVIDEVQQNTLKRIRMMPFSTSLFYIGKSLAFMVVIILQMVILFVANHFIFGVNFGGDPLAIFLCIFAYSFALMGLMILLMGWINDQNALNVFYSVGVPVLAALGGSMVPVTMFPAFFETISRFLPNRHALDAFFSIILGRQGDTIDSILFLIIFGIASIVIGIMWQRFGKKEGMA